MAKKASKAKPGKQHRSAQPKVKEMAWHWSPRRPQDGKSFGNPALYATPQTVASLVRETGQNSLDAAAGGPVVIRYRLVDLPAGSHRRQRFEERMLLASGLRSHLEAVAKAKQTQSAARIGRAIRELERPESVLRLLIVEDYGTKGLSGEEFDSEGNFSALVRDVENSHKSESTAGGSFGLGSKSLWSCSGLLTVLFASQVHEHESNGVRVIGKADLGYHDLPKGNKEGYVGPGFFGQAFGEGGAVSRWLEADSSALTDLCLSRKAPIKGLVSGTSALIVAFDDPESEDDDNSQAILEKLRRSIARNFWPALTSGLLHVFVRHEVGDKDHLAKDDQVDPIRYAPSFVEAYKRHLSGDVLDKLRHPGDVVSVPIPQIVPATRPEGGVSPEHGEVAAEARLVIRLSDETAEDRDLVDSVAMARGRAMVTQYMARRGVALNARPFHAFLVTGTLAGADHSQRAAEIFLRHAEPPSHDEWKLWSGLKARYSHGAGRRLEDLFREVSATLAQYVAVKPEASDEGPDSLKRLLMIPSVITSKSSSWKTCGGRAYVQDDVIVFQTTFEIDKPDGSTFTPRVDLAAESGNVALDILELTVNGEDVKSGSMLLHKGDKKLMVEGKAASTLTGLNLSRCAIRLSATLTKVGKKNVDG